MFLYSGVYPTNSRCVSHQSQCIPLSTTFCNLSTLLETKLQQFNKHVLYLLSTSIHVYLKFQLNKIEYLHHRCGFQIWGTHRDGYTPGKKGMSRVFFFLSCWWLATFFLLISFSLFFGLFLILTMSINSPLNSLSDSEIFKINCHLRDEHRRGNLMGQRIQAF